MLKHYLRNTAGNVAMMFAVSIMFVLVGIGAAIDSSNIQDKKSTLQSLADAAVLAAAVSGSEDQEDLQEIAENIVAAHNLTGADYITVLTILPGNTIQVQVSYDYSTVIMGMFGSPQKNIMSMAQAPPKGAGKLNLALVLDVTDSMEGTKLATLKTAATDLVNGLNADGDESVMYSVVPFARYVKLPLSFAAEPWLNVEPPGMASWEVLDEGNSVNCTPMGSGETAYTECETYVYTTLYDYREWRGCVASRQSPWNERHHYNPGQKIEGFTIDDWCQSEMLPLTTDVSAVNSAISSLDTGANTYIPAGLIWGWRTLMPVDPLTEANTADYDERTSALLLMTDGENTNGFGGTNATFDGIYHWGSDTDEANTLTASMCTDIKADGIIIYTVAFEVTDPTTLTLLQNCASDAEKFFDAGNTAALEAAFEDVGVDLSSIRLSK